MNGILKTQSQIGTGSGSKESEGATIDLAKDILQKVPSVFDIDFVMEKYPIMYSNSMNTVLKQVRFIFF